MSWYPTLTGGTKTWNDPFHILKSLALMLQMEVLTFNLRQTTFPHRHKALFQLISEDSYFYTEHSFSIVFYLVFTSNEDNARGGEHICNHSAIQKKPTSVQSEDFLNLPTYTSATYRFEAFILYRVATDHIFCATTIYLGDIIIMEYCYPISACSRGTEIAFMQHDLFLLLCPSYREGRRSFTLFGAVPWYFATALDEICRVTPTRSTKIIDFPWGFCWTLVCTAEPLEYIRFSYVSSCKFPRFSQLYFSRSYTSSRLDVVLFW